MDYPEVLKALSPGQLAVLVAVESHKNEHDGYDIFIGGACIGHRPYDGKSLAAIHEEVCRALGAHLRVQLNLNPGCHGKPPGTFSAYINSAPGNSSLNESYAKFVQNLMKGESSYNPMVPEVQPVYQNYSVPENAYWAEAKVPDHALHQISGLGKEVSELKSEVEALKVLVVILAEQHDIHMTPNTHMQGLFQKIKGYLPKFRSHGNWM